MHRILRSSLAASTTRGIGSNSAVTAVRALYLSPLRLQPASVGAAAGNTAAPGVGCAMNEKNATTAPNTSAVPPTAIAAGPYRRVGHIFIVTCVDHPFKFSWEVNRMLRELRLEFLGQTTIVPDVPQVRKRLWRVRHVVRVDHLDLDEAKALIGVPEHVHFTDLAAQLTPTFGRGRAVANPRLRSKMNFMQLRRMRLRDVMHRDQLEKKLLEERRKALQEAAAKA